MEPSPTELNHFTFSGLALALLGPGIIAFIWTHFTRGNLSLATSAPCLVAFILLVTIVAIIAVRGQKLTWADIGFGRIAFISVPSGVLLALFFIFVFGPAAYWALSITGLGSFAPGRSGLAQLPIWYVCPTVVLVAAGEEWLYRGYAIGRLEALTENAGLAGAISLLTFVLAHLPVWGIAASLTTLFSGTIFTALFIWKRDVSFLILAHVITDLYGIVIAPR
jgi:membrane protease YdiL (CAAX protease family)